MNVAAHAPEDAVASDVEALGGGMAGASVQAGQQNDTGAVERTVNAVLARPASDTAAIVEAAALYRAKRQIHK